MNGFNMRDKIGAHVERKARSLAGFQFEATWHWKCYRRGLLLWEEKYTNRVVDEGLVYALSVAFKDGTKCPLWYILLFEDDHTPVAGDDYADPGFTEMTAYDEATRPLWNAGDIIANAVTNALNFASFTCNATKLVYGGALVSDPRKGVPGAATAWLTEHPYDLDQIVVPAGGSPGPPYSPNDHYYRCTVAGTSAVGEPSWPIDSPDTVTDGEVTWQDIGVITDEIMFSSGTFDVPKPVEDDDIVKVSIEITANAIIA